MYVPLVVGILCLFLFCYALLCVLSTFLNHLEEEERAGCFAFIVLRMYCYCKYSVTLPRGAVGCVIVIFPDYTHLRFGDMIDQAAMANFHKIH